MKKIVILSNHHMPTYDLRADLIKNLINKNYEVHIVLPYGEKVELLKELGCKFIDLALDRRGMNPINDLKLFFGYFQIIKRIQPEIVLTYTIKPNVFGGIVCRILKTPNIANITGLGTSIENKGILGKISLLLYKIGLRSASKIFFQNSYLFDFFINNRISKEKQSTLIPGSGVNLNCHVFEEYPPDNGKTKFLYIGRIMKAKGVDELLDTAKTIKESYPNTEFHFIGEKEKDYNDSRFNLFIEKDIIKYHGRKNDVHKYINESHAIVMPSYHEGMCNVLLEGASTGRPVLASTVSGCIETFDEGVSGFGFQAKSVESLIEAIKKFIEMPYDKKRKMGLAGRKKMEKEFDRQIVVDAYLREIGMIVDKDHEMEEMNERQR